MTVVPAAWWWAGPRWGPRSPGRGLPDRAGCFQQALLTQVHLRANETRAQVGAGGCGVSTAAAGRYVTETVEILADHAPACTPHWPQSARWASSSWTAPVSPPTESTQISSPLGLSDG
ncbi:transposase family protein [Streptomyces flavidovirens]